MMRTTSIALTIAGSDSGGGAGIQADLKAFSALGVFGTSVITAITAQNTCAVTAVHEVPANIVAAQIETVLSDIPVSAIKLGMLFSPEIITVVAKALADFEGPIITDPVMIAKSGDALLQDEAIHAFSEQIVPITTLLTTNLPEAARLLGKDEATTTNAMSEQGNALLAMGSKAVLMKGGHFAGATCMDVLISTSDIGLELSAKRVQTQNTHGTGCTYSASIAAHMALGQSLNEAVANAHDYLQKAIQSADKLTIGSGHGPVHHFHEQWK